MLTEEVNLRILMARPPCTTTEKINDIKGIERIRFTSPHLTSFGKDLIHAFGDLKKLGSYPSPDAKWVK